MIVPLDSKTYEIVWGSDIKRDGMFLEAAELLDGRAQDILVELFYWDQEQRMMVTLFRQDIPLTVLEYCIQQARLLLPPGEAATG